MTDFVTALDLGGTHVTAGRVDLARATVERGSRVALPADADRDELLARIVGAAKDVPGEATRVACAAPGPFDYARGIGWVGHKLEPLYGVDLGSALAAGLDLPRHAITFVNDADAFLLGESWAGAARGYDRAVGVTLGTGLGSAFLAAGRIVDTGATVPPDGELHRVSYRNRPVEETISRQALIERHGEAELDVEEIAALARAGDARAEASFAELGAALGEVLAPWLHSFAATCLVVGGSISRAWELFEPSLRRSLAHVAALDAIRRSELLDDAALLGAARHVAARNDVCVESTHAVRRRSPATAAQVAAWRRERLAAGARPLHELSVTEARAAEAAGTVAEDVTDEELEIIELEGPVPIRLYRPAGLEGAPVCVWLPGGGWVLDTADAAAPACRRLALATPCAVACIRYRLAPEHPFPAALEDVVAATRWLVERAREHDLDPKRVAIGGASAGANLAAAVTLVARGDDDLVLAAQVLVYPVLARDVETSSRRAGDDPVFFDARAVAWCWSQYLARGEDARNPLAAPLLADSLEGLPPALVVTAGLDPLRDEGELYAERLRSDGVPVECVRFEGIPHGFFSRAKLDAAGEAQRLVTETLRTAFL